MLMSTSASVLVSVIGEFVDDFGPDFTEDGEPLEAGESDRIESVEVTTEVTTEAEGEAAPASA